MVKQHLEGYVTGGLKHVNAWYLKLQVMPLAYTPMPADHIALTDDYAYLIESKETKSGRFEFKRLTQEKKLIRFEEKVKRGKSYVCILYWNGRYDKSKCYMIPIKKYLQVKKKINKKSINEKDCEEHLKEYTINFLNKKMLDLTRVIK